MRARSGRLAGMALIVAAATLPYVRTLGFGFVYDDQWTIQENAFLREPANLARLASPSALRGVPDADRPVFVADEIVDWAMFGARTAGWHVESVAWHAMASLLAARVAQVWLGAPGLVAGLLYAVHPAHVEATAAVNDREDLLCATFVLAALAAVARRRATGHRRWLAAEAVLALLALGSKETAFVLPLLVLALDLAGAPAGTRRAALRAGAPDALVLGTVVAAAALAALALFAGAAPAVVRAGGPAPPGAVAFTAGWQLLRALVPLGLSPEHVLPAGLSDPRWWGAAAGLGGAAWLLARGAAESRAAVAFAVLTLLPTLPLFPVHNPVADRHLVLPSLAACALLARARLPRLPAGALPALAGVAFLALVVRDGGLWRNNLTLFAAAAHRAPSSARAQLGVARALHEMGAFDRARPFIERAASLAPDDGDVHMTRAIARGAAGDLAGALADLDDAARLGVSEPARLRSNRGYVLFRLGRLGEALAELDQAVALVPGLPQAHWNRALVLEALGRVTEASAEARTTLRLAPQHPEAARLAAAAR